MGGGGGGGGADGVAGPDLSIKLDLIRFNYFYHDYFKLNDDAIPRAGF